MNASFLKDDTSRLVAFALARDELLRIGPHPAERGYNRAAEIVEFVCDLAIDCASDQARDTIVMLMNRLKSDITAHQRW